MVMLDRECVLYHCSQVVCLAVLKNDVRHFDCTLFHALLVLNFALGLGFNSADDIVGLALVNKFEFGNHPFDHSLLDHKKHADIEHGKQEVNL